MKVLYKVHMEERNHSFQYILEKDYYASLHQGNLHNNIVLKHLPMFLNQELCCKECEIKRAFKDALGILYIRILKFGIS